MSQHEEHIERLIVRKLDGEISEDEALELNRELIRDPKTQETLEVYGRIDDAASSALEAILSYSTSTFDVDSLPPQTTTSTTRRINRGWWLVPGAIAAALLAVFAARLEVESDVGQLTRNGKSRDQVQTIPLVRDRAGINQPPMHTVGNRPSVRRNTGRDVIGVVGEDGNFYWIEVDRTRTIRRPRHKPVVEF